MISIGIAAYNEENNIGKCLSYLKSQLKELNLLKSSEIIVCLNGCNDKTGKIVKRFKKDSLNKLRIIHARKGKLNAHKKILEKINHKNPVLFCDADVLVPKETILAIIRTFDEDKNAKVVSGYPSTIEPYKTNWYQKIIYYVLNLKRIHPKIEVAKADVSKYHGLKEKDSFIKRSRIYFHGRFFGIKNKDVYKFPKKGSKIRGDDTFLTRVALLKFGPGSIKVLFSSPVYCMPLHSIKDYLKSEYRIRKDIDMIKQEYPEFDEINKNTKMTLNWEYYKTLDIENKVYALLFLILKSYEKYSYILLRRFINLDSIWSYDNKEAIRRFSKK